MTSPAPDPHTSKGIYGLPLVQSHLSQTSPSSKPPRQSNKSSSQWTPAPSNIAPTAPTSRSLPKPPSTTLLRRWKRSSCLRRKKETHRRSNAARRRAHASTGKSTTVIPSCILRSRLRTILYPRRRGIISSTRRILGRNQLIPVVSSNHLYEIHVVDTDVM